MHASLRTALVATFVFAASFGARRSLTDERRGPLPGPGDISPAGPPQAAVPRESPAAPAPEPEGAAAWIRLAGAGDLLTAEAAVIEALRPLGREKWVALFREMGGPGVPEQAGTRMRQAILRLWAAEAPEEALEAVRGSSNAAEIEIPALALLARYGVAADASFRSLSGAAGWHAWASFGRWAVEHAPDRVGDCLLSAKRAWTDAWMASPDGVLGAWFRRDPSAVMAWLKGEAPAKLIGPHAAARIFAGENEPLAREWFDSLEAVEGKERMAAGVANSLARQGRWDQARWWMERAGNESVDVATLTRQWSTADASAARDWALQQPAGSDRRRAALSGLAASAAATMTTWEEANASLRTMPEVEQRREVAGELLQHLPPALAVEHLSEAPPDERASVVAAILRGKPPLPLDDAIALAEREASRSTRGFSNLVDRFYDERGPAAAFDWVAKHNTPDDLIGVVNRWAATDPRAAAAALVQDSQTVDKSNVFMNLAALWMQWDVESASAWFAGLPAGSARDASAPMFVQQLHASDPGAALGWAASISDAGKRRSTLTNLATWFHRLPAEKWTVPLTESPLSGEEKAIFSPKQP